MDAGIGSHKKEPAGAIWLPIKQSRRISAREVAGYKIIGTPHPACGHLLPSGCGEGLCRMGWRGEKVFPKGRRRGIVIGEPLPGKVGRTKGTPLTRQSQFSTGQIIFVVVRDGANLPRAALDLSRGACDPHSATSSRGGENRLEAARRARRAEPRRSWSATEEARDHFCFLVCF